MILFSRFLLPILVIFLSIFVFIALCWVYKKLKKLPPEFPLPQTNKINKLTISDKKMQKEWDKLQKKHKKTKPKKFHITPDIYLQTKTNCSIGKQHKKKSFNWNKFKDNFTITKSEGKHWAKILAPWVNWRNWVLGLFIFGIIYGYGYFRGQLGKPMSFKFNHKENIHLDIPEDAKEFDKPANSSIAYWIDKRGNKTIVKQKDSKYISEKLRPYGFELEPFFCYGAAIGGDKVKQDVGVGVTWLRYRKARIANWLSNNGLWIGVDYSITKNLGVLIGVGKGYDGSSLVGGGARFWFK